MLLCFVLQKDAGALDMSNEPTDLESGVLRLLHQVAGEVFCVGK